MKIKLCLINQIQSDLSLNLKYLTEVTWLINRTSSYHLFKIIIFYSSKIAMHNFVSVTVRLLK